jgi:hypothetical protein
MWVGLLQPPMVLLGTSWLLSRWFQEKWFQFHSAHRAAVPSDEPRLQAELVEDVL